MVNRSDAYTVYGGDTLQMDKTAQALRGRGVDVDTVLANEIESIKWRCDLVHMFNIQTAEQSLRVAEQVKARGLPLALSTIYWDPLPGWYRDAGQAASAWRHVARFGGSAAYPAYRAWQRLNYPRSKAWQSQRQLLMMADCLLPNSQAELDQLFSDFKLPPAMREHAAVVVNGIDAELYREQPSPSGHWKELIGCDGFVLEVGRISPEKNTLGLIDALYDTDVPLVFAGNPSPYSPDYTQVCEAKAKARGNVHFLGFVPHDDLPGLYALAAVHALASWRETPGLVSLEAAAAGCRVVSTSIGSAREYLGDRAWYCDPADKKSIRNAVNSALAAAPDPGLRAHVLSNYTWEHAADATSRAYRSMLGAT